MTIILLLVIGGWAGLFVAILKCPQRQRLGAGWSNDHAGMSSARWVGSREYLNHEKD